MDQIEIMAAVTEIFRDVLDDDSISLQSVTTAKDIDEWDSLNHIQLVVAIEKRFNMRFTSSEIQSWRDVGAMCEAIEKRLHSH